MQTTLSSFNVYVPKHPQFGTKELNTFETIYKGLASIKQESFPITDEMRTNFNLPSAIEKVKAKNNKFYIFVNGEPKVLKKDGAIAALEKISADDHRFYKIALIAVAQSRKLIGAVDLDTI